MGSLNFVVSHFQKPSYKVVYRTKKYVSKKEKLHPVATKYWAFLY